MEQFLEIQGLEKFDEFLKELEKVEPRAKRKLFKSAFKSSSQIIKTAQKRGVSALKKRTGYLRKSIRTKRGKGKKWTYIRVGIIDPKPYLLKGKPRFNSKGIRKNQNTTRYKPRPSTYGGIWHEYGFNSRGLTHVQGIKWFTKSYKDNLEKINKQIVADITATIEEMKKNY